MATDPYFSEIAVWLIDVPDSSAAELAEPVPEMDRTAVEFSGEIDRARGAASALLKPQYRPPRDAPFLAFPQEGGVCDVVRSGYFVGKAHLSIAQTEYLIEIKVSGFRGSERGSDAAKAAEVAGQMLALSRPVRFVRRGRFRNGSFGTRDVGGDGRIDPHWPHWEDELRWWVDGEQVGFITLKAFGGPTREVISPAPEFNRKWF